MSAAWAPARFTSTRAWCGRQRRRCSCQQRVRLASATCTCEQLDLGREALRSQHESQQQATQGCFYPAVAAVVGNRSTCPLHLSRALSRRNGERPCSPINRGDVSVVLQWHSPQSRTKQQPSPPPHQRHSCTDVAHLRQQRQGRHAATNVKHRHSSCSSGSSNRT